jgi:hypothetical protein
MTEHDTLPPRGHNNPPEMLPVLPLSDPDEASLVQARALAAEAVDEKWHGVVVDIEKVAAFDAQVAQFCDAAGAWARIKAVSSSAQSERLTDFVSGARSLYSAVDEARKAAKRPHDERAAAVQKAFSPMLEKLERVAKSMKAMQAAWLSAERARIEREKREAAAAAEEKRREAERLAAEAAARDDISGLVDAEAALKEAEKQAAIAARPAKARAGSATGGGRAMALRTTRSAEIVNLRACFAFFQADPGVKEAIQRAADAAVRAGMSEDDAVIAGIKIVTTETAA